MPGFETLKVAPERSSIVILPFRARLATSSIARTIPRTPSSSARRIDRDDEAVRRIDGDADVDVAEDDVRVLEDARVHRRVLADRARGGDDREREHREGVPLLLVAILVRLAEARRFVEIHLGHRHDVRRRELRVGHVVGGDPAAAGERDDLVAVVRPVLRHLERAVALRPGSAGRSRRPGSRAARSARPASATRRRAARGRRAPAGRSRSSRAPRARGARRPS